MKEEIRSSALTTLQSEINTWNQIGYYYLNLKNDSVHANSRGFFLPWRTRDAHVSNGDKGQQPTKAEGGKVDGMRDARREVGEPIMSFTSSERAKKGYQKRKKQKKTRKTSRRACVPPMKTMRDDHAHGEGTRKRQRSKTERRNAAKNNKKTISEPNPQQSQRNLRPSRTPQSEDNIMCATTALKKKPINS